MDVYILLFINLYILALLKRMVKQAYDIMERLHRVNASIRVFIDELPTLLLSGLMMSKLKKRGTCIFMPILNVISTILAPVVMISSCTLFMNGLIQRYEGLGDRLRVMHIEHLDLLRTTKANDKNDIKITQVYNLERLKEIEIQLPHLLKRHALLCRSIVTISFAISVFVLSMFIIGIQALSKLPWLDILALGFLLVGAGMFLFSVLLTSIEFTASPHSLKFEVQHGLKMSK